MEYSRLPDIHIAMPISNVVIFVEYHKKKLKLGINNILKVREYVFMRQVIISS